MTAARGFFRARAEEALATRDGRRVEGLRRLRSAVMAARAEAIPRDLNRLAEHLGVREVRRVPLAMHGRIARDRNGLVVELNEDDPQFVQTFTLAHELAHLVVEWRRAAESSGPVPAPSGAEYDELERLCDHLAAETLLPEAWLAARVDLDAPSLATAGELAADSGTPADFVVQRAVELHLWRATAAAWRFENDYAVATWVLPALRSRRPPPRITLAEAPLLRRARTGELAHGSLQIPLTERRLVTHTEALVLPDGDVVSIGSADR